MSFLDRDSPVPLYHQFKQYLVNRIESGDYRVGEAIPSEMEMVTRFRISRATIRRGMQELEQDGYISRVAGRGTFVLRDKVRRSLNRLTSFTEDMNQRGYSVTTRILEFKSVTPPTDVADLLKAKPLEPLPYIYRLRYADNLPIAINVSYLKLPENITLSEDELTVTQSLWTTLERKGVPFKEASKTIMAVTANREQAELLDLPEKAALLVVEGVTYTYDHIAVEYHQVISGGERYKYSLHLVR